MKYYVTADVHGYYSELIAALTDKGFFTDTVPHKLIICGDLFDRGAEALKLQSFILDLMEKDEIILIRGNHEDLLLQLLDEWAKGSYYQGYHIGNGTLDTVFQLTESSRLSLLTEANEVGKKLKLTPCIQRIIPAMVDYYETEHYVFVHGWIPCARTHLSYHRILYSGIGDWRHADKDTWDGARWINGMEAAHEGIAEEGKIIVCGHWHCSFGHSNYEGKGGEFDNDPDFTPYYADGIIALDACTATTGFVNCIIIEDTEL